MESDSSADIENIRHNLPPQKPPPPPKKASLNLDKTTTRQSIDVSLTMPIPLMSDMPSSVSTKSSHYNSYSSKLKINWPPQNSTQSSLFWFTSVSPTTSPTSSYKRSSTGVDTSILNGTINVKSNWNLKASNNGNLSPHGAGFGYTSKSASALLPRNFFLASDNDLMLHPLPGETSTQKSFKSATVPPRQALITSDKENLPVPISGNTSTLDILKLVAVPLGQATIASDNDFLHLPLPGEKLTLNSPKSAPVSPTRLALVASIRDFFSSPRNGSLSPSSSTINSRFKSTLRQQAETDCECSKFPIPGDVSSSVLVNSTAPYSSARSPRAPPQCRALLDSDSQLLNFSLPGDCNSSSSLQAAQRTKLSSPPPPPPPPQKSKQSTLSIRTSRQSQSQASAKCAKISATGIYSSSSEKESLPFNKSKHIILSRKFATSDGRGSGSAKLAEIIVRGLSEKAAVRNLGASVSEKRESLRKSLRLPTVPISILIDHEDGDPVEYEADSHKLFSLQPGTIEGEATIPPPLPIMPHTPSQVDHVSRSVANMALLSATQPESPPPRQSLFPDDCAPLVESYSCYGDCAGEVVGTIEGIPSRPGSPLGRAASKRISRLLSGASIERENVDSGSSMTYNPIRRVTSSNKQPSWNEVAAIEALKRHKFQQRPLRALSTNFTCQDLERSESPLKLLSQLSSELRAELGEGSNSLEHASKRQEHVLSIAKSFVRSNSLDRMNAAHKIAPVTRSTRLKSNTVDSRWRGAGEGHGINHSQGHYPPPPPPTETDSISRKFSPVQETIADIFTELPTDQNFVTTDPPRRSGVARTVLKTSNFATTSIGQRDYLNLPHVPPQPPCRPKHINCNPSDSEDINKNEASKLPTSELEDTTSPVTTATNSPWSSSSSSPMTEYVPSVSPPVSPSYSLKSSQADSDSRSKPPDIPPTRVSSFKIMPVFNKILHRVTSRNKLGVSTGGESHME